MAARRNVNPFEPREERRELVRLIRRSQSLTHGLQELQRRKQDTPTIDRRPRSTPALAHTGAERPTVRKLRRLRQPRLVNDDGTPTTWWAIVNIIAPTLLMIAIVALAIVRQ
jgi:hypothetical protein